MLWSPIPSQFTSFKLFPARPYGGRMASPKRPSLFISKKRHVLQDHYMKEAKFRKDLENRPRKCFPLSAGLVPTPTPPPHLHAGPAQNVMQARSEDPLSLPPIFLHPRTHDGTRKRVKGQHRKVPESCRLTIHLFKQQPLDALRDLNSRKVEKTVVP